MEHRSIKSEHNWAQELRSLVKIADILNIFCVSEIFSVLIMHHTLNITML